MEEIGATTVIRLDVDTQQFVGFTADAPDDGFSIDGGKGYIVNVTQYREAVFVGAAWTNLPSSVPAAPRGSQMSSAWGFVVSGNFAEDNHRVSVRNTRTNAAATDYVRDGYFAAAFADLGRRSVVEIGDSIEIRVTDQAGNPVSEPTVRTVTAEHINQAFLSVTLDPKLPAKRLRTAAEFSESLQSRNMDSVPT